jgi:hypothetical protein
MSNYNANYGGRMGINDARAPEPNATQRQDSLQHAVAGLDPLVLRRTLLVSGTAGHAARIRKSDERA